MPSYPGPADNLDGGSCSCGQLDRYLLPPLVREVIQLSSEVVCIDVAIGYRIKISCPLVEDQALQGKQLDRHSKKNTDRKHSPGKLSAPDRSLHHTTSHLLCYRQSPPSKAGRSTALQARYGSTFA